MGSLKVSLSLFPRRGGESSFFFFIFFLFFFFPFSLLNPSPIPKDQHATATRRAATAACNSNVRHHRSHKAVTASAQQHCAPLSGARQRLPARSSATEHARQQPPTGGIVVQCRQVHDSTARHAIASPGAGLPYCPVFPFDPIFRIFPILL